MFALAEMLHKTVAEVLDGMSASEMTEWGLYLKLKNDEQEKAQKAAAPPPRRR